VGRLWCPKFIPDIEKFLAVTIHISNLDVIGQCWIFAVLWRPFLKWQSVEIFQCRESIRDIIIYPHIKFWWYRTMLRQKNHVRFTGKCMLYSLCQLAPWILHAFPF
jgi:hypothetical protein